VPSQSFAVTHSSAYPNWRTENALFMALDDEFRFKWDAAASFLNKRCCGYFGPDNIVPEFRDALTVKDWTRPGGGPQPFAGRGAIFINPPSSREDGVSIGPFVAKCDEQARDFGATIVAVVPHKTSSSWWKFIRRAVEIREIPYRVRYWIPDDELAAVNVAREAAGKKAIRSGDSAGFDSAVVIWRPQPGVLQPATPRVVTWAYSRTLGSPTSLQRP
jgi:phage N-6-adenine-methyltransferase